MENAAARATQHNMVAALCMGCMEPATADEVCPRCGWAKSAGAASVLHLAPGTPLQNYLVGRVLGQGGFGITYIGWDTLLHRKVAIKEFFPQLIASRAPGGVTVTPSASRAGDDFAHGLASFMNEGRILARFSDHPCIVSVLNLFEANNTGYLVMGYLEGVTLAQAMSAAGGKLGYAAAREIMMRVLDGLREVHAQGLLHRDISPDNIYLTRQGPVKILDFGAAKMTVGERSQTLSVVLKEGYAPEEQYRREGRQGSWTDIYAAAATFYKAITGVTPPSSLDRLAADRLEKPSAYCPDLPAKAESAILRGMATQAGSRYQTIEDFQNDLPAGPSAPYGPVTRRSKRKLAIAVVSTAVGLVLGYLLLRSLLYWRYETEAEAYYRAGDYESARDYFEKTAAAGKPSGEMFLGRMWANGQGVAQDFETARRWYEQAAAAGNAEAMDNLGLLYENGFGVPQDGAKAADWYRQAGDRGSADAIGRLAILYHDGSGVAHDDSEARRLFEKAAAQGSTRAMSNLGIMYETAPGGKPDYAHARSLYEQAAAKGCGAAMVRMAFLYDNGRGVDPDPAKAREWYEKAAAAGDPWGMVYLGDMYGSGRSVSRDPARQRQLYDKAASTTAIYAVDPNRYEHWVLTGRGAAQRSIGDLYRYPGPGATPDFGQAVAFYQKAAADGDDVGMSRLGAMFAAGQGVDQNYPAARQWDEKAISLGNSDAMNNLAVLYFYGRGVPQSYPKARELFEKSAVDGNSTAMRNLGNMYNQGPDGKLDSKKAREWWGKAADAGDIDGTVSFADDILADVNKQLSSRSFTLILSSQEYLQDLQKARQYLKNAADSNDSRIAPLLKSVEEAISRVNSFTVNLVPQGNLLDK